MERVEIVKPDFRQVKEILMELIGDIAQIENSFAEDVQNFNKEFPLTSVNIKTVRVSNKEDLKKYILQAFTK